MGISEWFNLLRGFPSHCYECGAKGNFLKEAPMNREVTQVCKYCDKGYMII